MINKNVFYVISFLLFSQIQNIQAREPGVGHGFPPGITHGIPTGALPPPGPFVIQRFNYSSGDVVDNNGDDIGVEVDAYIVPTLIGWSSNWELFGGRYMTFLVVPYMVDLNIKTPVSNNSSAGFINPMWKHLLSWDLGSGLFTSAGMGYYFMVGDEDVAPQFDYILEPEAQISYLSKDWNITGQMVINLNGENENTSYESGDQIFFNFHAIRHFGKLGIGPIVNYSDQFNSDKNNGSFYGGIAAEDAEQISVGGMLTYNIGPTIIRAYYTTAIHARNTTEENNVWIHLDFPLRF